MSTAEDGLLLQLYESYKKCFNRESQSFAHKNLNFFNKNEKFSHISKGYVCNNLAKAVLAQKPVFSKK